MSEQDLVDKLKQLYASGNYVLGFPELKVAAEEIQALREQVKEYREHLQYFIDRVEEGTIRSRVTYMRYKTALENNDDG